MVVALVCATHGTAWAQAIAGSQLSGVVRDSSGLAIPGVEVTATKTDTGHVRTVFTGVDGAYALPNLPIGPYQLKVVLQGFNTYVRDGIVLQVGSNPEINVTLAVGQISEQVTVTANSTLVETKNTGVGQVIDNQRVMELPLNGRQATELIFLSGLATSAPAGDLNTNRNFPTVTISVAGGQANGITYIMDGGTHNDPFNSLNLPTPFPDALQEFKVETSALPARYGYHAASAVNLVTKSGSNQVHGDLFEFNRNYHFISQELFRRRERQPGPQPVRRHDGRADREEQTVRVRRLPGPHREQQPADDDQLRADGRDAGRRLHGVRLAGVQRRRPAHPGRRVRQQPHRPVQAELGGAELPEARAGLHRSVRQAAVRDPEQQHRASGAGQGRLHDQLELVAVRPLFLRGVRQPGDLRRHQRPDAQPHQPEQPGALAGPGPQSGAVGVDAQLAARDVQQDAERSAAAAVFQRNGSRLQGFQPGAPVHGRDGHGKRLLGRRRRHQPRVLQLHQLPDRRRRRPRPRRSSTVDRRQLDSLADRDGQQSAHQRPVHVQRADDGPVDGRLHDRRDERRLPPGEPGLRLRPQRIHRRLRAGQLARQAERHDQPGTPLGAVPADVEHLFVGEPLRSVAVRPERPQHRVSAGAGRPDVPGRLGLSGRFDDVREEAAVRATRWRGLDAPG